MGDSGILFKGSRETSMDKISFFFLFLMGGLFYVFFISDFTSHLYLVGSYNRPSAFHTGCVRPPSVITCLGRCDATDVP